MKNALLLHGTESNAKSNWFPWLTQKLEAKGWHVWTPDLPGADAPNAQRYTDYLLSHGWEFNTDSLIVGHSSGAVEILSLLQALPEGQTIDTAILVGAFPYDLKKHKLRVFFRRPYTWKRIKNHIALWRDTRNGKMELSGMFEKPFDFETIKTRARKFIFIHSDDDPYCPLSGARYLSKKLGGELTVLRGQKHFSVGTAGEAYREFPALLQIIETL